MTARTSLPDSPPLPEAVASGVETGRDPATGRWRHGNRGALVHGSRSKQVAVLQAPQREAIRARVLDDLGVQPAELPATLLGLVDRFAEASCIARAYFEFVEGAGVLTQRGRQRAAVDGWFRSTEMLTNLAKLIGLERRAKTPRTLAERLAFETLTAREGRTDGSQ